MAGDTLAPGFRFPAASVVRDAEQQAEALRASDVDPELWAGIAEPTLWGNDGFRAMSAAGQQIDGYIHVEHRFSLSGTVALGEPVAFSGQTISNEEVPRGRQVVQRFEARRADGSVAVVSEHVRLLPDLARMGRREARDGEIKTNPVDSLPSEVLSRKTLTPEAVATYSRPVGNEIHFDPAFAARYGYRAPLAQGLMTLTWMVGAVASRLVAVGQIDLLARFRRPVFWDDALTLVGAYGADGELERLCALNSETRVVCDLRIGGREAGTVPPAPPR